MLLPFLTGKPLESALVGAEQAAAKARADTNDGDGEDDEEDGVAGGARGPWRSPQRSATAYVRCLMEALHYLLRRRGLSKLQAKRVGLALRVQLLAMARQLTF